MHEIPLLLPLPLSCSLPYPPFQVILSTFLGDSCVQESEKRGKEEGGREENCFSKADIDLHYFARKIASTLGNILRYASAPERRKKVQMSPLSPVSPFCVAHRKWHRHRCYIYGKQSSPHSRILFALSPTPGSKNRSERLSCMFILMQKFSSCII